MKKGRHRRFEEARKLKQAGPSAFDLVWVPATAVRVRRMTSTPLGREYGVVFDDDEDDVDVDIDDASNESDDDADE